MPCRRLLLLGVQIVANGTSSSQQDSVVCEASNSRDNSTTAVSRLSKKVISVDVDREVMKMRKTKLKLAPSLLLLVGLPGSGKSSFSDALKVHCF